MFHISSNGNSPVYVTVLTLFGDKYDNPKYNTYKVIAWISFNNTLTNCVKVFYE